MHGVEFTPSAPPQSLLFDRGGAQFNPYAPFTPHAPHTPFTPHAPQEDAQLPQPGPKRSSKLSSKHIVYAVEIFVFAVVGWGWLGVREYMGATPVMDVSVLLCLLLSSGVNLVCALVYPTTEVFKGAAKGFLAHVLSLWVLYFYSLLESTTVRTGPLCCDGVESPTDGFSVTATYITATFGGLPLHQAAAAVTLAFLSVLLLLAAGQARACLDDPSEWLAGKVCNSIACLVCYHLALFVRKAGVCGAVGLGSGVIAVSVMVLVIMVDVGLAISLFREVTDRQNRLYALIQKILDLSTTVMLAAMTAVLSSMLGGVASTPLMLLLGGLMLWQAVAVALAALECSVNEQAEAPAPQKEAGEAGEAAGVVGAAGSMGARFRGPGRIILPGAREMRMHGASSGGKKAW